MHNVLSTSANVICIVCGSRIGSIHECNYRMHAIALSMRLYVSVVMRHVCLCIRVMTMQTLVRNDVNVVGYITNAVA